MQMQHGVAWPHRATRPRPLGPDTADGSLVSGDTSPPILSWLGRPAGLCRLPVLTLEERESLSKLRLSGGAGPGRGQAWPWGSPPSWPAWGRGHPGKPWALLRHPCHGCGGRQPWSPRARAGAGAQRDAQGHGCAPGRPSATPIRSGCLPGTGYLEPEATPPAPQRDCAPPQWQPLTWPVSPWQAAQSRCPTPAASAAGHVLASFCS